MQIFNLKNRIIWLYLSFKECSKTNLDDLSDDISSINKSSDNNSNILNQNIKKNKRKNSKKNLYEPPAKLQYKSNSSNFIDLTTSVGINDQFEGKEVKSNKYPLQFRDIYKTYESIINEKLLQFNLKDTQVEISNSFNFEIVNINKIDIAIFLKVFLEYQEDCRSCCYQGLYSSRYYFSNYDDHLQKQNKLSNINRKKDTIIEYFARILALKSKIFNTYLILNQGSIDMQAIIIYSFYDSFEKGFFKLQILFKDAHAFINSVILAHSEYAITNITADIDFLKRINNISVLNGNIKNNTLNPIKSIENVVYNDVINILINKGSQFISLQKNIDLLNFDINQMILQDIDSNLNIIDNFKTIDERNVSQVIENFFSNFKKIINFFKDDTVRISIYNNLLKLIDSDPKTNLEKSYNEWIPKLYRYVSSDNFKIHYIEYLKYTLNKINDEGIKIFLLQLVELINSFSFIIENVNNKDEVIQAECNKLIRHFKDLFYHEELRNLQNIINKWVHETDLTLELKKSIYHYLVLFNEITLKTLILYKNFIRLYYDKTVHLYEFSECFDLPEYMFLFIFDPNSFETSFSAMAE